MIPGRKETDQFTRLPLTRPALIKSIREEIKTTICYSISPEKVEFHTEIFTKGSLYLVISKVQIKS
jgi:hypothetical protein